MLKIQNKASIYVFIGLALVVTTLYIVLFFVNKNKKVKVTKVLKLPAPTTFSEQFNNKEGFQNLDYDLSNFNKLVIKTNDEIYKNINIFCNDNTKDIEFYILKSIKVSDFEYFLKNENFTFYFKMQPNEINKYIIDTQNFNVLLTVDNSLIFGNQKSTSTNVGIILNNNNNKLVEYEQSIKNQLKNKFRTMDKVQIPVIYVIYFYFINNDPNNEIWNKYNSMNDNPHEAIEYLVDEANFIVIINILYNAFMDKTLTNFKTMLNYNFQNSRRFNFDQSITNFNNKFGDFIESDLDNSDSSKNNFVNTNYEDLSEDLKLFVVYNISTVPFTFYFNNNPSGYYIKNVINSKDILILYYNGSSYYYQESTFNNDTNKWTPPSNIKRLNSANIEITSKNYIKIKGINYFKNISPLSFRKP